MGITQQICEIMTGIGYNDLPADCISRVKRAIKDGLAVAVAGADQQPIKIMAEHLKDLGAKGKATVWGHGFKTSPMHAALINGMSTHVLDFEPMWSPPTHSVSPTVPVAFALAEAYGNSGGYSGKQIVTALAKGIEIQGRMQYAGNQYVPEDLPFHPPGVSGCVGAAVTAGHLLKLNTDQLRHAIGIAGSRAGSILANVGSMTKSTHCGNAGAQGLDAALLAKRGFTGNMDVFEAHKGIAVSFYNGKFDAERFLAFGKPYRIVDPGHAIKMFPSQFATHFAITAGLDMHAKFGDAANVKRVEMRGPVMNYIDRPQPVSGLAGKFSLQYAAAAAMLDGHVKIDTFTDKRRFRADMVNMLGKITLIQDESIPNDLHDMRIELTARMIDGTVHHVICKGPKGSWGMAPLSDEEHTVKLRDCFARAMLPVQVEKLLANLDRIEKLSAQGVLDIVKLIARGRKVAASTSRRKVIK